MDNNLCSLGKLKKDIKTLKLISFVLLKDKRVEIKSLEKQIEEMEGTITLFNSYFTDLGWCAYDSMDMSLIKRAVSEYESHGADAGERVLLNYYKEDVARIFSYEKSEKRRAGECREMFSSKNFCSFEILKIEERGCSMTRILVQVDWEVNGKHFSEPLEFGSVYQNENGRAALPWHGNGTWILIPWKIQGLYKI